MEEQTTWRGHGFTLFVFGCIVFLCATFFVLGMLVGRSQGQKYASANADENKKAQTATQGAPDFTVDTIAALATEQPPQPTLIAPPEEPEEPEEPVVTEPEDPAPAASSVIQVEAFKQRSAAEKLVKDLSRLGFSALIVPPASTGKDAYYRVQVGPYEDGRDAESARQKLVVAGYRPIIKR